MHHTADPAPVLMQVAQAPAGTGSPVPPPGQHRLSDGTPTGSASRSVAFPGGGTASVKAGHQGGVGGESANGAGVGNVADVELGRWGADETVGGSEVQWVAHFQVWGNWSFLGTAQVLGLESALPVTAFRGV